MTREDANAAEAARQLDVKIDVAIEIMAEMVAATALKELEAKENNDIISLTMLEEKCNRLLVERNQMYARNMDIVNKILTVYSKELAQTNTISA